MNMRKAVTKAGRQAILRMTVTAGLALAATGATAQSLSQTLVQAYENSGLLDQNRALLRAADEDVAQATSALLPILGWTANASTQNPRTPGTDAVQANLQISAELTLFDSGANRLAIEAQKEIVLATREGLRGIEQDVLLRAVEAYMNVRRTTEFVALRQNNLRLITQELRAAQDRFEVGEVTRTDVSLAEARLAASRGQLAVAEGELSRAIGEFVAAVGIRPNALQPAAPAPLTASIADARALAVRQHPAVLEAQRNVSAAELNIRRAEAALNPTVSLSASAGLDQDQDFGQQVGVTVRGPIYQGGALSSQIRQFMSRRDAIRSGLIVTVQQVEQNVGNAYSFYQVAGATRAASVGQVSAAQIAFDGVREEATLGARTTLDVLNAEQELLDAQANLISAQVDETIASYAVLASMGLLTASHLNLPVQQYDPSAYYNLVRNAPTVTSSQGQALDRVLRSIGD